jgi:uncharacterized protein YkwD
MAKAWVFVAALFLLVRTSPAPAAATYDRAAEGQLVERINQSRAQHGLPLLKPDTRLEEAAHKHSQLMAFEKTLSHQLPGESSFRKRLALSGAFFYAAGETAAYNYSVERAQESFMHSPPHRAIILDPRYDAVGVGVVEYDRMVWVTEDFAQLPDR